MNIRFASPRKVLAPVLAAVAAGALVLPVLAATPAETVKLRQETMKQLGGHMKEIKAFATGAGGSAADVERRAEQIAAVAAKIPSLFPQGTGMNEVKDPKNGAKPEIWLEWDKFTAAARALEAEAMALAAAANDGDPAAIAAAFQSIGKNGCGACHQPYRVKLDK